MAEILRYPLELPAPVYSFGYLKKPGIRVVLLCVSHANEKCRFEPIAKCGREREFFEPLGDRKTFQSRKRTEHFDVKVL